MAHEQFKTEQERFWAGEFGTEYIARNRGGILPSKLNLFSKILQQTRGVSSAIEFGANIGLNLLALKTLLPEIEISGIEINKTAYSTLKTIPGVNAYNESILNFHSIKKYDLSLCVGVLIHINPEFLPVVYDLIYGSTSKYLVLSEYYNPIPVSVPYRGYSDRLFKRDFAGEIMDRFPDVELLDYGFVYHRDPVFPSDDCTWFLLKKRS